MNISRRLILVKGSFLSIVVGIRIIDEFLAKSGVTSCNNFRETAEMIAKVVLPFSITI